MVLRNGSRSDTSVSSRWNSYSLGLCMKFNLGNRGKRLGNSSCLGLGDRNY